MFKLVCARGEDRGKYYRGWNYERNSIDYCESYDEAPEFNNIDATGVICAAIDMLCVVLVPQKTKAVTVADCHGLVNLLASGFFRNPTEATKDMMLTLIREVNDDVSKEATIEELEGSNSYYMSVYQYLYFGVKRNDSQVTEESISTGI